MTHCPVPQCDRELKGRGAVLCSDHYFALNPVEARMLLRMKAHADNSTNADEKTHLKEQFQAQLRNAVRKISQPEGGQCA